MVLCGQCPDQNLSSASSEEDTVNVYSPPTLQKLSIQSLLKDEKLAISVLKDLSDVLFPPVFEEAVANGYTKILKAIIPLWPSPYLYLGMLMYKWNLECLKSTLEGLDILLAQKDTSRCKLRVLNFIDKEYSILRLADGTCELEGLSVLVTLNKPMEKSPDCEVKKELKVICELNVMEGRLDQSAKYLIQWAWQRKDSIHLCCRNLNINGLTKATFIEILKIIHAGCIHMLILGKTCIEELDFLISYLTQMNSLSILMLHQITGSLRMGDSEKLGEEKRFRLIPQDLTLSLQNLNVHEVSFIKGNLKEYLRCLKKPLKKLGLSNCELTQSDLDYLPYCLNIFELKGLHLNDRHLHDLFIEPLGFLLERVRDTLQTLNLASCCLEDSHFSVLMPALSQCTHLKVFDFYDNNVSLPILKQILHHTAQFSQLTYELYPAPLECYDENGILLLYRFKNFCPELLDILRVKRQPKQVKFQTTPCSKCGGSYIYDLQNKLYFDV